VTGAGAILVLVGPMRAAIRQQIAAALAGDPAVVCAPEPGPAADIVAVIKRLRPGLVLLAADATADAYGATRRIMTEAPTPIVLIADGEGDVDPKISNQALRSGALAVLRSPAAGVDTAAAKRFVDALKAMSAVKLVRRQREKPPVAVSPVTRPKPGLGPVVAIAASTGGPAALERVLADLPADFPAPILVVQHMADGFIGGLAQWLNATSPLAVKVAVHDEPLQARTAYVAADGRHFGVSSRSRIVLSDQPPINGFRPAATFLFESAARAFGPNLIAVVLTGMGRDGVDGLRAVRQLGGEIIVQDEASSVVWGMPKAAIEESLADDVLPLTAIGPRLAAMMRETRS